MSTPREQTYAYSTSREQTYTYSTSQEQHAGTSPYNNARDIEATRGRSSERVGDEQTPLNSATKAVVGVLGTTYCLIILGVMLIIPILEVAIGAAFRNQCTINPNIPIYLIVTGACGMATIILTIAISAAFACCILKENFGGTMAVACIAGLVFFVLSIMSTFLFAWFIVGNVWIFGAKKNVDYDNVSSPNYCHRTLYDFAFTMLILSYIMCVISCCTSCLRVCFIKSPQEDKN